MVDPILVCCYFRHSQKPWGRRKRKSRSRRGEEVPAVALPIAIPAACSPNACVSAASEGGASKARRGYECNRSAASRRQQVRVCRLHCSQDFGSASRVVNDSERLQSEAGREHDEPDEFSCADTSGSDQVAGCDGQPPGKREASDGAAETDVIISAAELDSRRKLIDV